MKIKNYLRAGERKSIARYQAHFSGARLMAGTVYRVASLFAPVAVLAVLGLSAAHFAGNSHHSQSGILNLSHFGVMGLTASDLLKNLNKQKDDLLDRQETILNSCAEAKRKPTDAENEEFDRHTATINDLNTQIDRYSKIAAERAKLALPTSQAIVPTNKGKGLARVLTLTAEYAEAFFANFAELGRIRNDILFEGADTDSATGGVVAPVVYEGQVVPLAPTDIALRQLATVRPTVNDVKIPVQLTRAVAALKAQSTSGGTNSFSATNPTVALKTLSAEMNGNYVPASLESLQDIGYLQDFVQSDISRAVLDREENSFTAVLLDPTDGATPYTATTVDVADPESFLDIVAAQKSYYDANSSWLMDKSTGLAIYKQQIADNQFLQFWSRQNGRNYFHDYPVFYSSRMKGAKTAGSPPTAHDAVAFGDFKAGFIIGDRNNSAVLIKVDDDITSFKDGIINVFAYRRTGSLVRNQEALHQVTL